MEKKKSSIDWLVEQLLSQHGIDITRLAVTDKAKAMHKKEIMKSNRDGVDMVIDKKPYVTGEQYYNETYGGQDE